MCNGQLKPDTLLGWSLFFLLYSGSQSRTVMSSALPRESAFSQNGAGVHALQHIGFNSEALTCVIGISGNYGAILSSGYYYST